MSFDFLGYNLFDGNILRCVNEIVFLIKSKNHDCNVLACLNPHSVVKAKTDEDFQAALHSAKWLLPDGIGVVHAARMIGLPLKSRITGPDVFLASLDALNLCEAKIFFLGSSKETLVKIQEKIAINYPRIRVVGAYSPPFKVEFSKKDNALMVSAVNRAQPDVLWVGMTAPKQEKWLYENRLDLQVAVAGAIGAAFDFYAGNVKRSPKFFRDHGLEWLPRLIRQPHHLWRRIFISVPLFFLEIYRFRLKEKLVHSYFYKHNKSYLAKRKFISKTEINHDI